MAATLEELQAAITAVGQAIAADAEQDQKVILAIEALIAKVGTNPDFTNEVSALAAAVTTLQTSNTGIQSELDKVKPA